MYIVLEKVYRKQRLKIISCKLVIVCGTLHFSNKNFWWCKELTAAVYDLQKPKYMRFWKYGMFRK